MKGLGEARETLTESVSHDNHAAQSDTISPSTLNKGKSLNGGNLPTEEPSFSWA